MAEPIHPHDEEDQTQSYESGDNDEQRAAHEKYGDNQEPVEGPREDYDQEAERIARERKQEQDDEQRPSP